MDEAKPRRIAPGHKAPMHDKPCERIAYDNSKQLFEALKEEAKDG